jgi:hypothetical protein
MKKLISDTEIKSSKGRDWVTRWIEPWFSVESSRDAFREDKKTKKEAHAPSTPSTLRGTSLKNGKAPLMKGSNLSTVEQLVRYNICTCHWAVGIHVAR